PTSAKIKIKKPSKSIHYILACVAQRDIIGSQTRLEASMAEIKQQISHLEDRMTTVENQVENRVSNIEDRGIWQERALGYLLIYGIPEDTEGKAMIPFITGFFKMTLKLQEDMIIFLETAHRATTPKPKPTAPPRFIIVRFLDFSVKQAVLQQVWKQRDIEYQGRKVYFNQDYSPEVVRKRKQIREVIKKLKERNIKAHTPYPAQLRVFLDTDVVKFLYTLLGKHHHQDFELVWIVPCTVHIEGQRHR
uniref:L1 transposable element RRM domain-containing protein n=1 Tax=Monopterus albus TaxID=43700 RepID=A0A3Q3ISE9_MONAL